VIRREGGALSEEEILHVLRDEVLRLFLPRHQTILVENHLHSLFPQLPRVERDVLVDPLTKLSRPWRRIEARKLLLKLHAEHLASTLVGTGARSGCWIAVISHEWIVTPAFLVRSRRPAAHAPCAGRARRRWRGCRARK